MRGGGELRRGEQADETAIAQHVFGGAPSLRERAEELRPGRPRAGASSSSGSGAISGSSARSRAQFTSSNALQIARTSCGASSA
jgi:hypothetical protein